MESHCGCRVTVGFTKGWYRRTARVVGRCSQTPLAPWACRGWVSHMLLVGLIAGVPTSVTGTGTSSISAYPAPLVTFHDSMVAIRAALNSWHRGATAE